LGVGDPVADREHGGTLLAAELAGFGVALGASVPPPDGGGQTCPADCCNCCDAPA
jgi:hypothetical protein